MVCTHTLALSIGTFYKNLASIHSEAIYNMTKQFQWFFIGFIFEFPFPCMQSFPKKHYPVCTHFRFKSTTTKHQQQKNWTLKPMFSHVCGGHIQINTLCGFECAVYWNKRQVCLFQLVVIQIHAFPWILMSG